METQFYKCKYCFKEFEPKRRLVQKYCSNSCRSKAYHVRQLKNTNKNNNTTAIEVPKPMSLPPIPAKTKIDKVSIAGVGNATLGNLAASSLKSIFTPENNKPATKGDLNKLLDKLNYRYHLINNYPPQPNGTFAYFDLQTNEMVFLKGIN
jgi:Fe-S-cluster-containing dehydrogenase component